MDLDLNKFRTLIPINALYENSLMQLAKQARIERLSSGDKIFSQRDQGQNSAFLMSGSVKLTYGENSSREVTAGTNAARYALTTRYDAYVTSEHAKVVWINRVLLERLLAWGESSSPGSSDTQEIQSQGPSALDSEWMMAMLQTKTFLKLPPRLPSSRRPARMAVGPRSVGRKANATLGNSADSQQGLLSHDYCTPRWWHSADFTTETRSLR